MKDFINDMMAGGTPVSRAAVYRMIEAGKIPVERLGESRSQVWTTTGKVARAFGLTPAAADAGAAE